MKIGIRPRALRSKLEDRDIKPSRLAEKSGLSEERIGELLQHGGGTREEVMAIERALEKIQDEDDEAQKTCRCTAKTYAGDRCRNQSEPGIDLCNIHKRLSNGELKRSPKSRTYNHRRKEARNQEHASPGAGAIEKQIEDLKSLIDRLMAAVGCNSGTLTAHESRLNAIESALESVVSTLRAEIENVRALADSNANAIGKLIGGLPSGPSGEAIEHVARLLSKSEGLSAVDVMPLLIARLADRGDQPAEIACLVDSMRLLIGEGKP